MLTTPSIKLSISGCITWLASVSRRGNCEHQQCIDIKGRQTWRLIMTDKGTHDQPQQRNESRLDLLRVVVHDDRLFEHLLCEVALVLGCQIHAPRHLGTRLLSAPRTTSVTSATGLGPCPATHRVLELLLLRPHDIFQYPDCVGVGEPLEGRRCHVLKPLHSGLVHHARDEGQVLPADAERYAGFTKGSEQGEASVNTSMLAPGMDTDSRLRSGTGKMTGWSRTVAGLEEQGQLCPPCYRRQMLPATLLCRQQDILQQDPWRQ